MTQDVKDTITENGIRLNNILTGCILASILWVGSSILDIKDSINDIRTISKLNQAEIRHNSMKINTHVDDKDVHVGRNGTHN